ncbi:MAG: nucleotide sugar dehydrogenase, partial [bacterium]
DFGVCSNPEFLREGSAIYDFYYPPFTIIGADDKRSGDVLSRVYGGIDAPIIRTDIRTAEMLKFTCNAFHALKVAFANEIGAICKAQGIDSHELMNIFTLDDKLNCSRAYLMPGLSFGGSCLPKDLRALEYQTRRCDINAPLIGAIMRSNELHTQRALDIIFEKSKRKVGILGLSFKGGTDDLRESPLIEIVETLIGKGYKLKIYDKNINLSRLMGANKKYIEEKIPHIAGLLESEIQYIIDFADVLVIGNRSDEYAKYLKQVRPNQYVVDFIRILEDLNLDSRYEGICW